MTAFRSLTDEQLAARHDPAPYLYENGERTSVSQYVNDFAPRVECIPSRDALPWFDARFGLRFPTRNDAPGMPTHWAPRPEFARPPVNRVLSSLRGLDIAPIDALETLNGYSLVYDYIDQWCDGWEDVTDTDELDHARKVLTRLAALA